MILNSYGVLLALVDVIRLALGLVALWLGLSACLTCIRRSDLVDRSAAEDRVYLTFLLTTLLVGLNLVSWPLLYLLLQSYVSEWPGVMCIYGVTRIGAESDSTSRFLPGLTTVLQLIKPVAVFLGGAWFVLYLLNRWTETGPLTRRLVWCLIPLGAITIADAAGELAYVVIPKAECVPSVGCCTVEADSGELLPPILLSPGQRDWLSWGYYGLNIVLVVGVALVARQPRAGRLCLLVGAGLAAAALSALFLVEVAAPALLNLPDHHCAYDLIPQVPESMVPVALYLAGGFALGWAGVVYWVGRDPETRDLSPALVRELLRMSFWAYLAAIVMFTLELSLA